MIGLNGREVNENLLRVRTERRRAHGIFNEEIEAGLRLQLASLAVDDDTIVRSNLLFQLSHLYARLGASLEPPLGYDKDTGAERMKWLRRFWRRLARRVITSSGEGFVQQQERINALYVRSMAAAQKLLESGPGLPAGERPLPSEVCLAPLPEWEPELVRAVAALGSGPVLVLTIPCLSQIEAFERVVRPCLAVGQRDLEVASCLDRFLAARLADPLEFADAADLEDYGVILIGAPEFLSGECLAYLIERLANGMRERAIVAVKVEVKKGRQESEPGFRRYHGADFIASLMERAGLQVAAEGPPLAIGRKVAPPEPEAEPEPEDVSGAAAEPDAAAEATVEPDAPVEPELPA
ncbi:MAG: hypothetical protein ACYC55_03870 [Candidatus Geothermincolia bacterium]